MKLGYEHGQKPFGKDYSDITFFYVSCFDKQSKIKSILID